MTDSSSHTTDKRESPLAKNVALAGVKSVTIYDPGPVAIADLGTQVNLPLLWICFHSLTRWPSSSSAKQILGYPAQPSLLLAWQN